MPYSRQDRINLYKNSTGVSSGEATSNSPLNTPQTRIVTDDVTGEERVVQYIRTESGVKEINYSDPNNVPDDGIARWHISRELNLNTLGTGVHPIMKIPSSTYLLEMRILITSDITVGSMDVDLGDGVDADAFINGWDGTSGSHNSPWLHLVGVSASLTEAGKKTGKFYSSDDTLDLKINGVASAGKIKVLALLLSKPISNFVTYSD